MPDTSLVSPALTLLLAVLGIFYGRDGAKSKITKVGWFILALTLLSGLASIKDAVQKKSKADALKLETERFQKETRQVNIFNIAQRVGGSDHPAYANLIVSTTIDDGANEEATSAPATARISKELAEEFPTLLFGKSDPRQVIEINGSYQTSTLNFSLSSRNNGDFSVNQVVNNVKRSYNCSIDCGGDRLTKPGPLERKDLLFTEQYASERMFGFQLADGSTFNSVLAELENSNSNLISINTHFSSTGDFSKFKQIAKALTAEFKIYGPPHSQKSDDDCSLVIKASIDLTTNFDDSKLQSTIDLKPTGGLDIDLCETPP